MAALTPASSSATSASSYKWVIIESLDHSGSAMLGCITIMDDGSLRLVPMRTITDVRTGATETDQRQQWYLNADNNFVSRANPERVLDIDTQARNKCKHFIFSCWVCYFSGGS
jgi:hypothetical protein